MKTLIPADELIGEGQSVHEAPLLQPEDAAEAALQHHRSAREAANENVVWQYGGVNDSKGELQGQ